MKEENYVYKTISEFLFKNGFQQIDTENKNSFSNEFCTVYIEEENYQVVNNSGSSMISKDQNIYWLIGVLTYYGYMDKNYKQ